MSTFKELRRLVFQPMAAPAEYNAYNAAAWETFYEEQRRRIELLEPGSTAHDPYDMQWLGAINGKTLLDQISKVVCISIRVTVAQFRNLREVGLIEFSPISASWSSDHGYLGRRHGWLAGRIYILDREIQVEAALDEAERKDLERLGSLSRS